MTPLASQLSGSQLHWYNCNNSNGVTFFQIELQSCQNLSKILSLMDVIFLGDLVGHLCNNKKIIIRNLVILPVSVSLLEWTLLMLLLLHCDVLVFDIISELLYNFFLSSSLKFSVT